MTLLLNIRRSLITLLKIKDFNLSKQNISTTSSLLWLNKHLKSSGSFKEKEKRFLKKDNVPENYQLIYKAPMESYVSWAMHISTVTASLISSAAMYKFAINEPLTEPINAFLSMQSDDVYYFAAGFLAINAIQRFVVDKFALRIYKNKDRYLAVYHSQLPLKQSHHHFERGRVRPVSYTLSPWNNATYELGGKTSLILEDYFKTPSEFHHMRGIGPMKQP